LKDPKTRLQEWLQGRGHSPPEYRLLAEEGPSHKKQFLVQCIGSAAGIDARGTGGSRRKAEQAAAAAALDFLAGNSKK
jgi:ribonuclease-3